MPATTQKQVNIVAGGTIIEVSLSLPRPVLAEVVRMLNTMGFKLVGYTTIESDRPVIGYDYKMRRLVVVRDGSILAAGSLRTIMKAVMAERVVDVPFPPPPGGDKYVFLNMRRGDWIDRLLG